MCCAVEALLLGTTAVTAVGVARHPGVRCGWRLVCRSKHRLGWAGRATQAVTLMFAKQ